MKFTQYISLLLILLIINSCKRETPKPEGTRLSCTSIDTDTYLTDRFTDSTIADYIISCGITVQALLTVQPGVVIEFENGAGLTIDGYGTLIARGTSTNPIVFKGSTDATGSWKGINFQQTYSNYSELSYVTVTGAGSQGFTTENILANIAIDESASVKMDHCTISKSLGNGIFIDGSSVSGNNPLINFTNNNLTNNTLCPLMVDPIVLSVIDANNTYIGNGKQFIGLRGTNIETSQQWNPQPIPYLVDGDMIIGPSFNSGSLVISQGTTVVFTAGSGIKIEYYGYLKLTGSAAQHVILTGEASTPGSWKGINYQSTTSSNTIYYADISNGGCCPFTTGSVDAGNLVVGGGSNAGRVSVSYSTISNSAACGVKLKISNGSSFVQNSGVAFTGNASGNVCNY